MQEDRRGKEHQYRRVEHGERQWGLSCADVRLRCLVDHRYLRVPVEHTKGRREREGKTFTTSKIVRRRSIKTLYGITKSMTKLGNGVAVSRKLTGRDV